MRHPVLLALVLSCTFAFALPDAVVAQSDAEIAMKGAREAFAADEFEKAVKPAETAAQTDGENPDIHLLLAKSRLQLGDLDESLASFRRVIEIAPKHSYAAQMVKALEGRSDNVALRLKLAADLLSDGMPGPASQELSAVKKSA